MQRWPTLTSIAKSSKEGSCSIADCSCTKSSVCRHLGALSLQQWHLVCAYIYHCLWVQSEHSLFIMMPLWMWRMFSTESRYRNGKLYSTTENQNKTYPSTFSPLLAVGYIADTYRNSGSMGWVYMGKGLSALPVILMQFHSCFKFNCSLWLNEHSYS